MNEYKEILQQHLDLMVKAEEYIWANPEVGFRETKTNAYMISAFESLGYTVERFDGIPGFTACFDTGREGATVLLLAELDALIVPEHPECDPETKAVHACGHNLQCAALLGVAAAMPELAERKGLCGRVKLCCVPAEEGIEISYRSELVEKGVISFTSGKPEAISRGLLDGVDLAFMLHIANFEEDGCRYAFNRGSNGVIRKKIDIFGRSAHAGGAPWNGINALYAAELVLSAANSLRETFREKDCIRFHPIITEGGRSVNAIPDHVVMESYVRGGNPDAILRANRQINRAIAGACLALGAKVTITDNAGSEPRRDDLLLQGVMAEAATKLTDGKGCLVCDEWLASSTDMGDISCLVPSVHAYVDGHRGILHGSDYRRLDPSETCLATASLSLATIAALLENNGREAARIKAAFQPIYPSVDDYLCAKRAQSGKYDCIDYQGGEIKISLS